MKNTLFIAIVACAILSCRKEPATSEKEIFFQVEEQNNVPVSTVSSSTTPTTPDHVVFVWFENKGFSKIVGSSAAPYINSLIKKGVLFTNTY
ncbi:MAG: hypothetical protein ICV66_10780, partial [Chitinophagaceae bacterium]|nr:hypothetical protein [Chitinophagaceae bacterium]